MVWANQRLDELVKYQMDNVYEKVPEAGFEEDIEKPSDITVGDYFEILFNQVESKLKYSVPAGDKKDLDVTKLV